MGRVALREALVLRSFRIEGNVHVESGSTDPVVFFLRGLEKGTERFIAVTSAIVTPTPLGPRAPSGWRSSTAPPCGCSACCVRVTDVSPQAGVGSRAGDVSPKAGVGSRAGEAQRWATFDCYGTLIDWHGGIVGCFRRLWPTHDFEHL